MARLDELIALAAMGELEPEEAVELAAAVRDDPDAAARLDRALATAAALQTTDPVPPPPRLRPAVLAAIAVTPQEPALPSDPGVRRQESEADRSGVVVPLRPARRVQAARWLVAVAAVLVVAVGVTWATRGGESGTDQIAAVMEADDVVRRELTDGLAESLTVGYSASEAALVVLGEGVPVLSAAETYQLWLVDGDGATSAGLFRPDDDGVVEFRVDGVDPTGFTVGVTREPAAGSATPTLPILASA